MGLFICTGHWCQVADCVLEVFLYLGPNTGNLPGQCQDNTCLEAAVAGEPTHHSCGPTGPSGPLLWSPSQCHCRSPKADLSHKTGREASRKGRGREGDAKHMKQEGFGEAGSSR